jgi:hypothetical protein
MTRDFCRRFVLGDEERRMAVVAAIERLRSARP